MISDSVKLGKLTSSPSISQSNTLNCILSPTNGFSINSYSLSTDCKLKYGSLFFSTLGLYNNEFINT